MVLTPEIMKLRRVGNCKKPAARECIIMRNSPADTQVIEERQRGGDPGTRAAIPLQPVGKTMVKQAVPLKPIEVWGRADIHLQPVKDPILEHIGARSRL